jgi:hypothetical protein
MRRAALILMMLSLTAGCASPVTVLKPPACPEAGALVADDVSQLKPLGLIHLRAWLGRVQRHCEAIDAMRWRPAAVSQPKTARDPA